MKLIVNKPYSRYTEWLASLPCSFESGETVHNGRNVIRKFDKDGQGFIVKRFKIPNFIQKLSYTFFKPSKAQRAYEYSFEFMKRGVLTPDPVAYIETFRNGMLSYSYYISTVCEWPEVRTVLPKEGDFSKEAADAFALYLADMQNAGVFHGDLNLGNFMYHKGDDGSYEFCALDINRSRFVEMDIRMTALSLCRLSHRRDMFEYIVRKCALAKGWNPDLLFEKSFRYLSSFEKRNVIKRKLKSFFKRKKN